MSYILQKGTTCAKHSPLASGSEKKSGVWHV